MDRLNALRSRRSASGFTLVEVMIAAVLLAIGLLAMLALQMHAMRDSQLGRHYTGASQVARDRMEELMRMPWGDPALTANGAWQPDGTRTTSVTLEDGTQVPEQTFTRERRVSIQPLSPARLKQIDVRVTWYEAHDDPAPAPPHRRYALTTQRFN
jgi:type IV pilus modification protein PilV